MSEAGAIIVRLLGSNREELQAGVARLRAAGLDIVWRTSDELEDGQVDGTLQLYDTPESVERKMRGAANAMRSAIKHLGPA